MCLVERLLDFFFLDLNYFVSYKTFQLPSLRLKYAANELNLKLPVLVIALIIRNMSKVARNFIVHRVKVSWLRTNRYFPVRTWTPRIPHACAPPTSLMISSPIITAY